MSFGDICYHAAVVADQSKVAGEADTSTKWSSYDGQGKDTCVRAKEHLAFHALVVLDENARCLELLYRNARCAHL